MVDPVPGGLHLDLHTEDVPGLAARVDALGGSTSPHALGYVVCGSPGGLTFCLVGHPGGRRPPPQAWPGGRSLVDQVCLDVPPTRYDAECAFWSDLTGWPLTATGGREFRRLGRPAGIPLAVLIQRLDDEQPGVTAHLDLACDDRDAEAARHQALGAVLVRRCDGWTVLRDPAGRTYCATRRAPGEV
ncbi:VOC family protein [Nocardioides panacis]|uniref:VOC family protein n=1 Tax=Nocardioides panacis TaxID=2849501 RepID=A0A975SYQ5_9ACTN|nr:VOC family protein [Nocardioides panacis]QWZ08402.1 VOC family protein [Nocardioides panacis]